MLYILSLALVATAVLALPFDDDQKRRALQNPDLFEGDILGIDPNDRNAIPYDFMRWTDGKVPYEIDHSVRLNKYTIKDAMKNYHEKTCVRFVERTTERNYIKIFSGDGCYSYVGMIGRGQQPVSLGEGCMYRGTIVHELGHAIGFFHEQNRSDRDKYLTIYWDNIQPGATDQFFLLKPYENRLLTPFDYDSIMLYGNYAFSKSRTAKTMVAKNGKILEEPYDKDGLSKSDIKRVRMLYKCDEDDDDDK